MTEESPLTASSSNGAHLPGHQPPGAAAAPDEGGAPTFTGPQGALPQGPEPVLGLPAGIRWQRSYTREDVERFLAEAAAARARLDAELAEARRRVEVVQARRAEEEARRDEQLGAAVLAAQAQQTAMEEEHQRTLAAIRAEAEKEAARVLAEAHATVAAMRQARSPGDTGAG